MSFLLSLFYISLSPHGALPNVPVNTLDLQRYVGLWYEIAHLPMFFQRQCIDSITATYVINSDGSIQVRNACRTKSGLMDEAIGLARPTATPGAFKSALYAVKATRRGTRLSGRKTQASGDTEIKWHYVR